MINIFTCGKDNRRFTKRDYVRIDDDFLRYVGNFSSVVIPYPKEFFISEKEVVDGSINPDELIGYVLIYNDFGEFLDGIYVEMKEKYPSSKKGYRHFIVENYYYSKIITHVTELQCLAIVAHSQYFKRYIIDDCSVFREKKIEINPIETYIPWMEKINMTKPYNKTGLLVIDRDKLSDIIPNHPINRYVFIIEEGCILSCKKVEIVLSAMDKRVVIFEIKKYYDTTVQEYENVLRNSAVIL